MPQSPDPSDPAAQRYMKAVLITVRLVSYVLPETSVTDTTNVFVPAFNGTLGRVNVPLLVPARALTPRQVAQVLYHLLLCGPGSTSPVTVTL